MKFHDRLAVRISFAAAAAVTVAAIVFAVALWGAIWHYDIAQEYKLSPALQSEKKELDWRYWLSGGLSNTEKARSDEITRLYYDSPTVTEQVVTLVTILVVCGSCAVVPLVIFVRRLVVPLLVAAAQARRAARGELSVRVAPLIARRQRGELAQLVRDFDTLLETVERNDRALRDNNKAIAQELEAPIAELHQDLLALRDAQPAAWGRSAAPLIAKVGQLGRIVDDLRVISLAQAHKLVLNITNVELRDLVSGVVRKFQAQAAQRNMEITQDIANVSLLADSARLEQALEKLIDGALSRADQSECLHIEGVVRNDMLCLRIVKGLAGFSNTPHPVVKTIVEAHGGIMGGGFEIWLRLK